MKTIFNIMLLRKHQTSKKILKTSNPML